MSRTAASRPGRVGRPWREAMAKVFARETHCWLCGDWVNQHLPPTHRMSRTADHLIQLIHMLHLSPAERHRLATDPSNARLAHRACNTARSNRLRGLPAEQCACSQGLPCARLNPLSKRGYVALDPSTV